MCFDAYYLSVYTSCGHAKRPPQRMGWLNCVNYPCAMRLEAEDPARYNYDTYLWRQSKMIPPNGTPAQTISFPERGKCQICAEWESFVKGVGGNGRTEKVKPVPDGLVKKVGYPVDLVFKPPKDGKPWQDVRPRERYWVYVVDGWKGSPLKDKDGSPMMHMTPMKRLMWGVDDYGYYVNVDQKGQYQDLYGDGYGSGEEGRKKAGDSDAESDLEGNSLGLKLSGKGRSAEEERRAYEEEWPALGTA